MTISKRTLQRTFVILILALSVSQAFAAPADTVPTAPLATGLLLWLDASDASSLQTDDQGHITRWLDRSGQHNDFVAEEDVQTRPKVVEHAMGPKNGVRFSGHQDLLLQSAIRATNGPATVVIVSHRFPGQVTGMKDQRLVSSAQFFVTVDSAGTDQEYPPTIYDIEETNVPVGPLAIGRSLSGDPHYFSGDIAEILIYDHAFLSQGDRHFVLDYLKAKWGAKIPQNSFDWTRVGSLGDLPKHARQDLPLSDQKNSGHWVLNKQVSDEFENDALDITRWHVAPTDPHDWKGRQPALFDPSNVAVKSGKLGITFRKGDVPEMLKLPGQGYAGYTSAFVRAQERTGYGYYEAYAKPMNSAAASAFWLYDTGKRDDQGEIDIFEIGAKAPNFLHKYNMNAHVWATPQEKRHWSTGGVWEAPWTFADTFHTYGFEWSKDNLIWYVDGVMVRKAKNTNWFLPMYVTFDSEPMWTWFGKVDDADLPSTFEIDYLRVWQKN